MCFARHHELKQQRPQTVETPLLDSGQPFHLTRKSYLFNSSYYYYKYIEEIDKTILTCNIEMAQYTIDAGSWKDHSTDWSSSVDAHAGLETNQEHEAAVYLVGRACWLLLSFCHYL